ncbi:MAG: hypothetical protein GF344_08065 [Chitinivibrionales bacterium]|nr:hypothetical protein [Chitinivibrionales bacterium]MBD3356845.1 hypothetical protein [Chitinivibrionales bacterium]
MKTVGLFVFLMYMLLACSPAPNAAASDLTFMAPPDSVPVDTVLYDTAQAARYSFRADRIELSTALKLFAQSGGLRFVGDTNLTETITVAFENVRLEDAMKKLLGVRRLEWKREGKKLKVWRPVRAFGNADKSERNDPVLEVADLDGARMFKINYPRLRRSGQGSSTASLSSTASGEAGSIELRSADEIVFWRELKDQIKEMLSEGGRLIINDMAGVIQVADSEERLNAVEAFLEAVVPAATRQVEITARIYEVSLDKDSELGVDWTSVTAKIKEWGSDMSLGAMTRVIQKGPAFNASALRLDMAIDDNVHALIQALEEQGEVHAVSQPRIVTLNNQPALIKIGTDYPYFSASVSTNPTTGEREVTEEVRVITVGVILSLTPQVSGDGWVTLGIDPLISDLVSTEQSENGSTAPIVDVKQSSALVRLRDRATVRISGLLQTKKSRVRRKVPLLGDIPLLKYLFRWSYTKETKKELVIFITPRIIGG